MFEKILICTDFADGLHRLTHFVSSLAAGGIKQVVFLHVVPLSEKGIIPKVDSEQIEQAQSRLSAAMDNSLTEVDVKIEVQSGRPVEMILRVAQGYQSELIVLGSQAHSLLTEKLIGSIMADLSHQTTIPLLVLRPQLIAAFTAEELALRCQHLLRYLLVPYDGSETSNFLVQQIKQLAQKQPRPYLECCRLCWVTDRQLPSQLERDTLSQVKADLETAALQVKAEFHRGSVLTELLELAQMDGISAIAIASGTIGTFQEWLVSSVAAELLRQSWCPVLFFPSKQ
ncbi:universal stress protein [Leptolyngbya sp. FACHB-17]|uniref:universal stress protein n=1 Tax=unclassified Leptolyngbya TaxID=2650499 RepID=UPI001681638C|nr:universal stress protein [Leptolyngbya sp. FACHB-17]MBD2080209.1 universal stress protein [Leptolyngbya sp. FACHB-17]